MNSNDKFQPSHTPIDFAKYEQPYEIERVKIIKKLLPSGCSGRAVDIGCGSGYFTKMITAKGWRTTAIDTDSKNIENAGRYAFETHLGDASSVLSKMPENQYGLVLASEIIEHMPKAQGEILLKNILRILKQKGILIISTPNKFSPQGLGHYYWGEKIRGWEKWDAWDNTHIIIYSSLQILRLVKAMGFAKDRIIGYHYEGILPIVGKWKLPFVKSTKFPFNRLGFNIIIKCHKR